MTILRIANPQSLLKFSALAPQLRCSVRAKLPRLLWCLPSVPLLMCGAVYSTPFRLSSAVWLWQWRLRAKHARAHSTGPGNQQQQPHSPSIDDHSTPSTFNFTAVQHWRFSDTSFAHIPNYLYSLVGVVETAVDQTLLLRRQVASVEIPQWR